MHGTRGLAVAGAFLLALSLLEPALPANGSRIWIVGPIFALLCLGLLTLPREAIGAQDRARSLLEHPTPQGPMARRLVWIAVLCIALLPRIFLGAYGIPHMSPLTGLLLPTMQVRIALVFLFLVLLLPVLYLRSSRSYKTDLQNPMASQEPGVRMEVAAAALLGVVVVWMLLLRSFWSPFSLLELPPTLESLHYGVRGVAAISFAIVPPAVLFVSVLTNVDLLWHVHRTGQWARHYRLVRLAALHLALVILAIVLHAYDLLWIVRYEAGITF